MKNHFFKIQTQKSKVSNPNNATLFKPEQEEVEIINKNDPTKVNNLELKNLKVQKSKVSNPNNATSEGNVTTDLDDSQLKFLNKNNFPSSLNKEKQREHLLLQIEKLKKL